MCGIFRCYAAVARMECLEGATPISLLCGLLYIYCVIWFLFECLVVETLYAAVARMFRRGHSPISRFYAAAPPLPRGALALYQIKIYHRDLCKDIFILDADDYSQNHLS